MLDCLPLRVKFSFLNGMEGERMTWGIDQLACFVGGPSVGDSIWEESEERDSSWNCGEVKVIGWTVGPSASNKKGNCCQVML